ncbi:hypothetical protein PF021_00570 [Helicobacter sp. A82]|uniref:CagY like protein n=2 Tax=Helicobacter ibis TaxID=2962633 RepID=A0ABT4VBT0_9HELI|nr:hypothetical protein [Helicobacter ibis]MDA3968165.1 hypothetical protein [Helicobacter ibis]
MNLSNLTEEKLKSKIKDLYFEDFNYFGDKIDFTITQNLGILGEINLLWAEAKNGKDSCIYKSFIQLILTIGKYRYNTQQTPKFLGAFDAEKFAFLPFSCIQEVFYQNDINWSITPSNHKTEQFQTLLESLKLTLKNEIILFSYENQSKELINFITQNLTTDEINKYEIDKNNFVSVYFKWVEVVKNSISIDWERAKQVGILDADFYLADLLSLDNSTITDKLYTILRGSYYEFNKKLTFLGTQTNEIANFKDSQKAHQKFWSVYKRPPREEFWEYIIERRDLLVAQDVRERKGAFFTPSIWVQKSQEYLAKALGEDWQEEYYIWDCAGGTGNLLSGLSNPRNIFCSTLDKPDVDVIKERIKNGANLFENHIFQFDFLNDEFFDKVDEKGNVLTESKVPKKLQEILKDEKKRQKLVIYINPPYAEATTASQVTRTGKNKDLVARGNKICQRYKEILGKANNELFAQFFIRIYTEISGCILGCFSTLKYLNSQNFIKFRETFKAHFLEGFIVPADTFDNVRGQFPIGFLIWDTKQKETIKNVRLDIFDKNGRFLGQKGFCGERVKSINQWIKRYDDKKAKEVLGYMENPTPDFQNTKFLCIINKIGTRHNNYYALSKTSLIFGGIYFTIRQAIPATWLNDRDQFYAPNSLWEEDKEFQSDCLAFALFHGQNRITSTNGINHFIPFTESEVGAKSAFESNFMTEFINGKIKLDDINSLFTESKMSEKLEFSPEAKVVFEAGREVYAYYHAQDFRAKPYNVNASLYDIKEFFQGRNAKGVMNPPSKAEDPHYKSLIATLTESINTLAKKLEPKIYEYGFLRE